MAAMPAGLTSWAETGPVVDHGVYGVLLKKNVSRIFKWFAEDFKDGVFGFYLRYATGDLKKELENKSDRIIVKYLAYDWSLNGE